MKFKAGGVCVQHVLASLRTAKLCTLHRDPKSIRGICCAWPVKHVITYFKFITGVRLARAVGGACRQWELRGEPRGSC